MGETRWKVGDRVRPTPEALATRPLSPRVQLAGPGAGAVLDVAPGHRRGVVVEHEIGVLAWDAGDLEPVEEGRG